MDLVDRGGPDAAVPPVPAGGVPHPVGLPAAPDGPCPDDPAADLPVDADLAGLLPSWHRRGDGGAHATPDAVERLEAELWWHARGER